MDKLIFRLIRDVSISIQTQWFSIYIVDNINEKLVSIFNTYNRKLRTPLSSKQLCCFALIITLFAEYTYSDISIDIILQIKKEESCFLSLDSPSKQVKNLVDPVKTG